MSEAAFAAIGALTLRSETNAATLADAGAVPVIVAAMELHPTQPKTQARGGEQRATGWVGGGGTAVRPGSVDCDWRGYRAAGGGVLRTSIGRP